MKKYLLIESNDPFDNRGVERFYGLAAQLASLDHQVTLFLVQNGVLPARRGAAAPGLEAAAAAGVEIVADDFSLRERGIDAASLAPAVRAAPIDRVIDELAAGARAIWH
ncbi:MAG TPA: DsrE family protein [Gammaproteobacteria bacterium]